MTLSDTVLYFFVLNSIPLFYLTSTLLKLHFFSNFILHFFLQCLFFLLFLLCFYGVLMIEK